MSDKLQFVVVIRYDIHSSLGVSVTNDDDKLQFIGHTRHDRPQTLLRSDGIGNKSGVCGPCGRV